MAQRRFFSLLLPLTLISTLVFAVQAHAQAPAATDPSISKTKAAKTDSAPAVEAEDKAAPIDTADEVADAATSPEAEGSEEAGSAEEAVATEEAQDNDADDDDHDDGDDDDDDKGANIKIEINEGDSDEAAASASSPAQFCAGDFCLEPGLRIRLRYDAVEDDATVAFVGRNDGFGLSSARLKLRGNYGWAGFRLEMDGGFIRQSDSNIVAGSTFAAVKDAWIHAQPFDFFEIWAGQFKAPFSAEGLRSTASLRFVERSVGDRGIQAAQGYAIDGLSQPRDVGVMLGADGFAVGPITLLYLASLTNGNGINQAYNDNSYPALHGRLELGLWDMAYLGAGALYNPRTVGVLPNLYDEAKLGGVVDFGLRLRGGFIEGSYTYLLTQYPTTLAPDSVAMAAHIEAGYRLWFGLGAAYRFAWFDPSSTFDYDALTEHSVALRYDLPGAPVALLVDYTISLEQVGRELQNNRLAGMLQIDF